MFVAQKEIFHLKVGTHAEMGDTSEENKPR